MSSLKTIADRIKAISSTHKVTSSMKVVALSRLRKMHEKFLKTTAYTLEIRRMIRRLLRSVSVRQEMLAEQGEQTVIPIPLILKGNGNNNHYMVVVITSDDGLSGISNLQVIQKTQELIRHLTQQQKKVSLCCFGTRGGVFLKKYYPDLHIQIIKRNAYKNNTYLDAEKMAVLLDMAFSRDDFDVCLLVYNEFKSVVSQKPTIEQIIPNKLFADQNPWQFLVDTNDAEYIQRNALGEKQIKRYQSDFLTAFGGIDMLSPLGAVNRDEITLHTRAPELYDYEPADAIILESIIMQYLISYIYRVLLETAISENAARLMSMDNATRNAQSMLQTLKKQYNRMRQAKITTDLIELGNGTPSL